MIAVCFFHQHPELYGRAEVEPEFPSESTVNAEPIPPNYNEGTTWYYEPTHLVNFSSEGDS